VTGPTTPPPFVFPAAASCIRCTQSRAWVSAQPWGPAHRCPAAVRPPAAGSPFVGISPAAGAITSPFQNVQDRIQCARSCARRGVGPDGPRSYRDTDEGPADEAPAETLRAIGGAPKSRVDFVDFSPHGSYRRRRNSLDCKGSTPAYPSTPGVDR